VRDFALISHNAQVYNRPSAPVYRDAIALRELFKTELQKLVEDKTLTAEEAELPDLGEIPPVEDSPPPGPDDEEAEEDEDEDEEDEEDDETDDDRPRRGRKKGRRSSAAAKKADDGGKDDPEAQKKRGRPPKVHTPMEARINTLLKGLRKFKNPGGDLKILHFEKLPDKSVMPEYYQEIKNPIAMDLIKRKAKRKKYHSVDQALKDLELMFDNAKVYNLEDSQVYRDAVDLQREARLLAEQEKKKPDSEFVDEDGRLPLPEILYNGELWKVGDWIHLTNPNDVTKPIVAQIYRTWQDPEGQKWINACWYYRPEQTVHRYEKHFFENEVVKTGQYRDHKIEEVIDRCFVMFFTRYNKGRPRGFPADKEVYVCEARYNEEKFKLNKIKTWASCVPDEVREKDYEMDLFDAPRKMKKVPSPIKHLLREDAKEDDPLPKPTWGAPNAPPIVGAVHKRPREANVSSVSRSCDARLFSCSFNSSKYSTLTTY
jgi:chromatin structure-remodeling complex subunit RSC1/2